MYIVLDCICCTLVFVPILSNLFLHRYSAHKMFIMSKPWERFFYLLTYLSQGSSYLSPRAYAILAPDAPCIQRY
jgi:stearoyl-CoA desaturase (delta-9 desaturase)